MPSRRPVPLSVLDLAPLASGSTPAQALHRTVDLARHAERLGYARYWIAEHHLTPSVVAAAPVVLMGAVAAATRRIRVGSGAVQTGPRRPVVIAEEFGTLAHLYPGRVDLGLGRSNVDRFIGRIAGGGAGRPVPAEAVGGGTGGADRVVDGLLVPSKPKLRFDPDRVRTQLELVGYRDGAGEDYAQQIRDIQAFVRGDYRTPGGEHLRTPAAEGADAELWVVAAGAKGSAPVAGELGLPLTVNYHSMPAAVLDAVAAYREAFRPSELLSAPHVMVSADVLVAEDAAAARRIARGYAQWAWSIRRGEGSVPYLSPDEADAFPWSAQDEEMVADRLATRFVGDPKAVVHGLGMLAKVTGADEILVTATAHDHADRVRSYELLANSWN
ncbi:LLM class flavin-dependent oxidoreductase [Streptomyces sp. NPDC004126]|uniref:LLM class flavin-dependent oxidoreductase n=1 Tax=Streptomyces sp. NPDC004126 TaxID=3390695 RepID=UPI003CFC1431